MTARREDRRLEIRRGGGALLFVAPHGGRRPPVDAAAPPVHLRVNDLYTPELTWALAERLDAGCIINSQADRNALDLNRLSQVRRRAPWFLALLVEAIEAILARHAAVEVVFVHGWNTGQSKCDIGIGAVETDGGLRLPDGAQLSVSDAYLRSRIAALRAACATAMISAPIGERYPAGHRNNLLQLLTPRAAAVDDPCARQIGVWVREGRINALQLELGIPLRWPGARRDRFTAAVVQAFGDGQGADRPAQPTLRGTQPSALRTDGALQFYDATADVGMFAGVGRSGPHALGGRVLLFLGGQRVALFTGEEPLRHARGVTPLQFSVAGAALRLDFAGPMLLLEDAAAYVDLEAALAGSRLVEAEVRLQFQPRYAGRTTAHFGTVQGEVSVDGRHRRIDTGGFANAGGFRAAGLAQSTMIAAAFGSAQGVLSRASGDGAVTALHFGEATQDLDGARIGVSTGGDRYTPSAFELRCLGQPPLRGRPLSRMPILRPAGAGGYLRVTFGVARFTWGDLEGYGLYEYAHPVQR